MPKNRRFVKKKLKRESSSLLLPAMIRVIILTNITVVHAMVYGSLYAFRMCTIRDCMHAMYMTSACSVLLDLR